MINTSHLLLDALVGRLEEMWAATFGRGRHPHLESLRWVARVAVERISDSDALYHDVEHTVMVTLVGQEILYGRRVIDGGVGPDLWLNAMAALLLHDIGYVRGVCDADGAHAYVTNEAGDLVTLAPGASDAALTAFHVDRSKIFIRETLAEFPEFDVELVARAVERTRFPVPDAQDARATDDIPGLIRAADLIGQLADPNYLRKANRLFHEFQETGTADRLGYRTPVDLAEGYPAFYWNAARGYMVDGLRYLQVSQRGKQWIANLTAHVFALEHQEFRLGPQRTDDTP